MEWRPEEKRGNKKKNKEGTRGNKRKQEETRGHDEQSDVYVRLTRIAV